MKKSFLMLFLFFMLFESSFGQVWKKEPLKNRWGDKTGSVYLQQHQGSDSRYTYTCTLGVTYDEFRDEYLFVCTAKINEYRMPPARYSFNKTVSVEFRNDNTFQMFSGTPFTDKLDYDSFGIYVEGEDAIEIIKFLQSNGTWDVLIENSDWYLKTKLGGDLPLLFDEKNIFKVSENGKLWGIKTWAKKTIDSVVIPYGINEIARSCFEGCKNLKSVSLPKTILRIDSWAFYECESLKDITFEEGLEVIESAAFFGCNKIKSLVFPKSIKQIGSNTFANCASLEKCSFLGDCEIKLSPGAFENCKSLKVIDLKDCSLQNGLCIYNDNINSVLNTEQEKYIIPKNVETLFGLEPVKEVVKELIIEGPTMIESIDFRLFQFKSLKSITVPKSVKVSHMPVTLRLIRK